MRKVPEKQKARPKERFFETSHKQVMYPRYHSNCALEKGAPLQAPASPMHSRGSHGRRLLIPAGGCSDLQLGRDRNLRYSAVGLAPAPGSLRTEDLVRLRHRFSYSLAGKFTPFPRICQEKFFDSAIHTAGAARPTACTSRRAHIPAEPIPPLSPGTPPGCSR